MRARIDITEVEEKTKIRAKYLRALENEEWSLLPGPTYAKTFLRTYADFLELDSKSLLEVYALRYERPGSAELTPVRALGRERHTSRGPIVVPRGVILAVALIGLAVALFVIGSVGGDSDRESTPPAVTRTSSSER